MTTFVLPGDAIPLPADPVDPSTSQSITFGPGIGASTSKTGSEAISVATKMGPVHNTAKRRKTKDGPTEVNRLWVEVQSKRYVPAPGEDVIGIIVQKHAEGFRVDIGAAQLAQLGQFAFEGASKKTKPRLDNGTVVHARVSLANRDMEPEIECVDPKDGKSNGYGELKGGLMVTCSLQLCRRVLSTRMMGEIMTLWPLNTQITVAPAMNGRIWLNCESGILPVIGLKRILEAIDAGQDP